MLNRMEIKMTEKEDSILTFSHEHIKITTVYSTVLLKLTWGLAGLFYNQTCQEVPTWSLRGRRSNMLGTHTPGRGHRGGGVY